MLMPNGPAATVGLALGARGGVHCPVSACASGAEALAQGLRLLRTGLADVAVVGGAEACVHPLPMAGFAQMRALSTRHDAPEAASRPYDKGRDGFVLGEGAGVLVLETEEHARARGARVHARLAGAGTTSDAHHTTAPDPSGRGAAASIVLALRDAGLQPSDVGHVNAHATSTPLGDVAEARALGLALGAHRPPVTAIKSCTGHLLGAAGAVEASRPWSRCATASCPRSATSTTSTTRPTSTPSGSRPGVTRTRRPCPPRSASGGTTCPSS